MSATKKEQERNGIFKVEEQYVLRVRIQEVADRIRIALRDEGEAATKKLQINFNESNVNGRLTFEGQDYPLTVLNLPTVVECYKSYDDVNLVKSGDVGQVLVVGEITDEEARTGEVRDGVTPPARNARDRVFRKPIPVAPEAVARVESQLLDILSGGAPKGYKFVDHEEVWEVDPVTKQGRWAPVKK